MLKSMTAYGRGEYELNGIRFVGECRSVNNRHRDIIIRIPGNFQMIEDELRSIVSSRVSRGRIELSVQVEEAGDAGMPYNLELNVPVVESYMKIFGELADQFGLERDIRPETLCQMKDVILVSKKEREPDMLKPGFLGVLEATLDSLDEMKIKEGNVIEADFQQRLELLEKYTERVAERAPLIVEVYRDKLKERIHGILGDVAADEGRITQEVAFFADRSDITEELVRMRSHLTLFRDYIASNDAVGRRLDFLIQEMNREINTASSKASDSMVSEVVIEMKAELEKLREQAQNVE